MSRGASDVLDSALYLVLAPPRADATTLVVERWRAGERGDPSSLVDEPVHRAPPRRRWWPWVAAAAAVLVALLAWTQRRTGELARSAEPLVVLRPGSMSPEERESFAADDTVVVGARAEAELALADGTRLVLEPRTLLDLAQRDGSPLLAPRVGSIRIEREDGRALFLATPLGTVEVGQRAILVVALEPTHYRTSFPTLVEEIHMHTRTLLISTSLTLLAGSASFIDGAHAGPIAPGQEIQSPPAAGDPRKELLLAELGTWDLAFTDFVRGTDRTVGFSGIETCTAGPGREWIFCDMKFTRSSREVSAHVVLGYSAHHQRYFGSLVDSFGGGMEVFDSSAGPDPKCRVLESRLLGGDDSTRTTMRWINDDERHTLLEVRDGESWVKIREIRHVRQRK